MPWNNTLNDLQRVLADLYPAEDDARRVAEQAGLAVSQIDFNKAALNVWHDVLGQALREDLVESVMAVARGEYPSSHSLVRAIEAYVPAEETLSRRPAGQGPRPGSRKLTRRQVLLLATGGGVVVVGGAVGGLLLSRCAGGILVPFASATPTAPQAVAAVRVDTPAPGLAATTTLAGADTREPGRTTTQGTSAPVLLPTRKPEVTPTIAQLAPMVLTLDEGATIRLLHIPAGPFLMGSDPAKDRDARNDELPQTTLTLPDYYLAETPVTNAQYKIFVTATKHRVPGHWVNDQPPQGRENHPVVNVVWRDALAFCDWASQLFGQAVQLPTEAQWEKGARGADGRLYPWGDEWDATRGNAAEGRIGITTPVDRYPQGASPYGVLDMASNVIQWTHSLYKRYPYDPQDGREDPTSTEARTARGGSWYTRYIYARCATRIMIVAGNYYDHLGFRVVMSPGS